MNDTGFSTIFQEFNGSDNTFNLFAFEQAMDACLPLGLDATGASLGEDSGYLAIDLEMGGEEVGLLAMIDGTWGYSKDNGISMQPTRNMDSAIGYLLESHIDDGGLIGY